MAAAAMLQQPERARDIMKTVLVATDGSAGADRAVDFAAALAHATGAQLCILTVQDEPPPEVAEALKSIEHVAPSEIVQVAASGVLAHASQRARRAGSADIKTRAEAGDPAQRILEVAAQTRADAIVAGKRGRGPLAALLLGSVSQKLVSLAPCPVIVVP
jgi:nucleotide-binding universal stress UspA family protein